jgi:hypothetical protein
MANIRDKLQKTEGGDLFGLEEALAKINLELLNPTGQKLLTVSDVTAMEIFPLAYLYALSKKLGSKIMEDWAEKFLLLRISRFRLGRREFVFISGGLQATSEARKSGSGRSSLGNLFSGFK